jgi:hypothetical protein
MVRPELLVHKEILGQLELVLREQQELLGQLVLLDLLVQVIQEQLVQLV